jgi:ParB/RepB/Spo0J family partition protein
VSTNEFRNIAIADLLPHPHNPRTDLGDPQKLTELANDLAANGNKTALRVFPIADGDDQGKFLIIEGHRRRAAAELGVVTELFCEIDPYLDTLPKQLESMLRENTHREPISAVNEAEAIQTMMTFEGYSSVAKVAKAINRSQATVRKRLLLNKLPEQAKARIEDHTLNIDQALVIVDFAEDQEATETLLQAAANPRDWSFAVTSETRKRDAPAKVEAFEKALAEAGATYLPEKDRYSGRWNRLYESSDVALNIEEHVAAGHQVIIERHWGKLEWFEKAPAIARTKPELTEEEKEAKRRDDQLTAALQIAHAVRAEHLKEVVKNPPEGAADEALYALLLDGLHAHTALYAEITGRPANPDDGHFAIKAALQDFTTEQMGLLLHLSRKSAEDDLLKLWAWDAGDYRHTYGPKGWLESLGTVYHYELSSVEQEVLDHFAAAYEAHKATIEAEDQEDEDYDDE